MCEPESGDTAPDGVEFIDKYSIEDLVEIIAGRCESFIFCCRPKAPLELLEDPDHILKFDGQEAMKLSAMLNYVITEEMKLEAQGCASDWVSIQMTMREDDEDEDEAFA